MWQHSLQLKMRWINTKKQRNGKVCLKDCFYLYKGYNKVLNDNKTTKPEENKNPQKEKKEKYLNDK